MKIFIDADSLTLTAYREASDPRFKASNWSPDASSTLLYHVKICLNQMGFDLIKKRMWKDGLLASEQQQYLRAKPDGVGPRIAVYDGLWAVRCAAADFNRDGKAAFRILGDIFENQPNCRELLRSAANVVNRRAPVYAVGRDYACPADALANR